MRITPRSVLMPFFYYTLFQNARLASVVRYSWVLFEMMVKSMALQLHSDHTLGKIPLLVPNFTSYLGRL